MDGSPLVFATMRREVRGDLDALTAQIIDRLQTTIPAYGQFPREALAEGVGGDIGRAIDAVSAGRPATQEELDACEAVGRERALQGIPVEALIRAFQIAAEQTLEVSLSIGERHGATPQELLDFSRIGWSWANQAMTRAALAHRETELELARRDVHQRDELVRRLVLDSAGGAELQLRLPLFGLRPASHYHVARARPLADEEPVPLRRMPPSGLVIGMVDGDLVTVAPDAPSAPAGWCAGVAGPAPLLELHGAFADASRALETAWTFGLEGSHRLEDMGVLPAVVLDQRLGDIVCERTLRALGSEQEQERVCATLEALFAHELRVPEAARALFVHENTVRKRLRFAEERTGLSLRRVDDLVVWWWALKRRQARC
jgi:hypothetical protein